MTFNRIGIVWDFDGTLTPDDSTMKTVEVISGGEMSGNEFFKRVKQLRGDQQLTEWKHIQAMDAPIWMYTLSRMASERNVPLNPEFFKTFVLPKIELYSGVQKFLSSVKKLGEGEAYQRVNLQIHHFIVTAGLKELIEQVFSEGLITHTYGCRYVVAEEVPGYPPENIPVYCVDETGKTRALFEISKGSYKAQARQVNDRVKRKTIPFESMIFIGDGDTDIPALSLVKERGGMGMVVYNPNKPDKEINKKLRRMRKDKRADLITPADFSLKSELYHAIVNRCEQIRQRCEAEQVLDTE